jgi:CBS domain-containing protein
MKVAELLCRKGARILSARMDETVETAARLLSRENAGALVVKDTVGNEGDTIVGMFSERDVLHAIAQHGVSALQKPLAEIMSRQVIHCTSEDTTDHVLHLMHAHQIRHIPVLDGHQINGVISIRDMIGLSIEERAGAAERATPPSP